MRKAIAISVIGSEYHALYRKLAPTYEHYAARHGWDIKVATEFPDSFVRQYSRPNWNLRDLSCAFKMYQPALYPEYDLLAIMDPDMIIHPAAPCLSSYSSAIPPGGIAAVQDVSYAERQLFDNWSTCHYDTFLDAQEVAQLPFPELHVNTGLVLVRPEEIKDDWISIMNIDSDMQEEDRINLQVTQKGLTFMLPTKWNVVYPYELVRRGYQAWTHPKSRVTRRITYEYDMHVKHPRLVNEIFRDVYVLHFASIDKRIPLYLDTAKLLSIG